MAGAGSDGRGLSLGWMMLVGKGMALNCIAVCNGSCPYCMIMMPIKGMDEGPWFRANRTRLFNLSQQGHHQLT